MGYVFSRVPGYDIWTGDKRIRCDIRRKEFVFFVINTDTMTGRGFKAATLPDAKKEADYFAQKFEFSDGTKV